MIFLNLNLWLYCSNTPMAAVAPLLCLQLLGFISFRTIPTARDRLKGSTWRLREQEGAQWYSINTTVKVALGMSFGQTEQPCHISQHVNDGGFKEKQIKTIPFDPAALLRAQNRFTTALRGWRTNSTRRNWASSPRALLGPGLTLADVLIIAAVEPASSKWTWKPRGHLTIGWI